MSKRTVVTEQGTTIKGEVVVSKFRGEKLVKTMKMNNNAVANMLIGVARYLRGDFLNLSKEGLSFIPAYLGVGYTESGSSTSFNQTYLASELTTYEHRFDVTKGDVKLDNTSGSVTLSLAAVIPSGVFSAGTHINELGLFAQRSVSSSGMLARVTYKNSNKALSTQKNDPNGESHILVETGMSYRIEWNIILTNK